MGFLKKKIGPISIWWLFVVGGIALIGIIVGSFVDLEISKAFATNDSVFAKLVESYGALIGAGMVTVSGAMLTKKLFKTSKNKLHLVLGGLFVALTIILPAFFMKQYAAGSDGYSWKYNEWIAFAWLIAFYSIIYVIFFYIVDDTLPTKILIRNGLYILAGYVVTIVLVNIVFKGLIYRPRYRALAWDNAVEGTKALGFDYYKNWWSFAFWRKPEWFVSMGIPKDYIKSWPSGHTATATCCIMLPFATSCLKKRSTRADTIVFIVASVFSFIVALGRMRMGAHFLSDVSSAIFLCMFMLFLPALGVNKLVDKVFKSQEELISEE